MHLQRFTFNPFAENTYILYDDTQKCIIIDPGCLGTEEEAIMSYFISDHKLTPVRLLNTHCHIDHIFGNRFVHEKWHLPLEANSLDAPNIARSVTLASMWGMPAPNSPMPEKDIQAGDIIAFGNTELEVRFAPGHSAGHVVFISHENKIIIGGDVLFRESVGRTDLPGGDHDTLISSIREQLYTLPDDYTVYPGHGPETTIGHEKTRNPFVKAYAS